MKKDGKEKIKISVYVDELDNFLFYSNLLDFATKNPDDIIGTKGYSSYKRMMTDSQVKAVINLKRYLIISYLNTIDISDNWRADQLVKNGFIDSPEKYFNYFRDTNDVVQRLFTHGWDNVVEMASKSPSDILDFVSYSFENMNDIQFVLYLTYKNGQVRKLHRVIS